MGRRSPSKNLARRMGRPRGHRARLVRTQHATYEVLDLQGGGQKVFRLELVTVPRDTPEWEMVQRALEKEVAR